MSEELSKEMIVAMAAACIAEELGTNVKNLRISNFHEVRKSGLAKYIEDNNISYVKYQVGE